MSDRPRIIVGLAVGLVALTFPFWYTLAMGQPAAPPQLELPKGHSQCVADREYMRAHHMEILRQWRDEVVRQGDASPVEIQNPEIQNPLSSYLHDPRNEKYPKSLTRGCMACHRNRAAFCDRCHNQVNVHPACWDCHCDPKEK